jgi:Co/Zn/Cd efflux system component
MADCCNDKACEIEALRSRQSATLKIVLGINAVMFLVEMTAGIMAGSVSLLADSLDMLGDALVWRHRADDINMSSVWLCSRNDIIANVSVLFAAFGVWLTGSGWPDIIVGLALAALFLRSALFVLRAAGAEIRAANANRFAQSLKLD